MKFTSIKSASGADYWKGNLFGNWKQGTWNVLPAVLSTWSNLLSTQGNDTQYDLYKQQAKEYIDNARANADYIRQKGEIELRNLRYKNRLERGTDIATVGANNGNMSGSNLDVIVQKEKIRKINEQTVNADYANRAMIEMYNGYKQAASVYGTLAAKAEGDKWNKWASIFKGIETYVGLSMQDAKVEHGEAKRRSYSEKTTINKSVDQNMRYGLQGGNMTSLGFGFKDDLTYDSQF